jgi:FKBP-type peptidyl-prolyl cis-trans isomerase
MRATFGTFLLVTAGCASAGGTDGSVAEVGIPAAAPRLHEGAEDARIAPPPRAQPRAARTSEAGLVIDDLRVGTGAEATAGQTVSVHYVATLLDGTKFDSSRDRGKPFAFKLGSGQVIRGWDDGVVGMKVGGLRKLTIPPQLAYGTRGAPGAIPPSATIVFEVELLGVR